MDHLPAAAGSHVPQAGNIVPEERQSRRTAVIDKWKPNAAATMVGSMPHRDRDKVIDLVLREFPEVPVWPQLSVFPSEQMMNQYLEGLPGMRSEEGRIFMDTADPDFEAELLAFYEEYFSVEAQPETIEDSRFRLGEETGVTFFRFLEAVARLSPAPRAVKGQVPGPFTLLSGTKDREGRALIYNDSIREAIPKLLAMKARWQIRQLKRFGCPVILFLDEPALAGFGSSAFISISAELVEEVLKEVIDAVHAEDALAGVHVCANTDWKLLFQADVDIINLDAYNYMDRFSLYGDEFERFINEGRIVAWGMVPTADPEALATETAHSLAERWKKAIQPLSRSKVDLDVILSQSLFTPSCGCGSLTEPVAEKVLTLTRELSLQLRR
jgi:methionine synthase II (cobalamin-independent)